MPIQTILSVLALLAAGAVGITLHGQNQDLEERVARLEIETGSAEAPDPGAGEGGAAATTLRGSRTAREVAELRRMTNALVQRVDENETRFKSILEGDAAAGKEGALALRTPAFGEAVREVVLDMAGNDVAFRSKVGTADRTKIAKNSPFAKLAEVLELDASQESQMSKDLQGIQTELFGILSEERDDGVVPMELIAKAESLPQNDPGRAEMFVKLFTLKIPGEEETYMQRAVKLQADFRTKTKTYLRPAQLEIWNGLDVDLFSIKFD
jgi:hypothetical protein